MQNREDLHIQVPSSPFIRVQDVLVTSRLEIGWICSMDFLDVTVIIQGAESDTCQ